MSHIDVHGTASLIRRGVRLWSLSSRAEEAPAPAGRIKGEERPADVQLSDPWYRAHPGRQDGRRPRPRSKRPSSAASPSRPRWSAPASAPSRSSRSSSARCCRPARVRSPRARPRSRAASRRRSPRRPINKVCASGMRTLGLADQAIRVGDLDVAVTGGMESMSKAPYLLPNARFGFRMGDVQALDAMTHDGLTNAFTGKQMINEASEVSNEMEITRADMDKFAVRSQTAGGRGDRGRPDRRRDRPGHHQGPQGRHDRRGRRGAAAGDHAGGAGRAEGDRRRGRDPHRRQRPGRQRRRRRDRRRLRGVGREGRPQAARQDRLLRDGRRRLRLPGAHPRQRGAESAGRRSARRPMTSTSGRSTRPSPRSRSARCGSSASTRPTST